MTPEEKMHALAASKDGLKFSELIGSAKTIMRSQAPRDRKYIRLAKVADECGKIMADYVPCKRGCSACCHLAVGITESEAQAIAEATGRPVRTLNRSMEEMHQALNASVRAYYNTPCPFLVDNACSVYESRPMACRTHHSLMDTNHECRTDLGSPPDVPMVPTASYSHDFVIASASLFMGDQMADIRQFFPPAEETP